MADTPDTESLTESLTLRVADLARLELSDEEVATFTQQIADILKYVDQLQKLDVSGIEPLTHPLDSREAEIPTPLREDRVVIFKFHSPDAALHEGFRVPPIL